MTKKIMSNVKRIHLFAYGFVGQIEIKRSSFFCGDLLRFLTSSESPNIYLRNTNLHQNLLPNSILWDWKHSIVLYSSKPSSIIVKEVMQINTTLYWPLGYHHSGDTTLISTFFVTRWYQMMAPHSIILLLITWLIYQLYGLISLLFL